MPVLLDPLRAAHGTAEAVRDERGALSWDELALRVNRWMSLLTDRGLGPGDRLACMLGNRREVYELLLACLHTGITVVPVNRHLTDREVCHLVTDSDSSAVVTDAEHVPALDPAPRLLLAAGEHDRGPYRAVEPLLAAASDAEHDGQTCGSTMLYTSGTTGVPKGVLNNMFRLGAPFGRVDRLLDYAGRFLDVPRGESLLQVGPWYHSAQLFFSLLPLLAGNRVVVCPRFDAATTLDVLEREQITSLHLVPTQFVRLLRLDAARRAAFSGGSLRRVWHGGGPCSVPVKQAMIDWWGPVLLEYYGATEAGAVTMIDSTDWLRRPGSVGRAVPPSEVLIVDDAGRPVPAGRTGRVYVRRRTGFSYHNAPEKTRAAHLAPGVFTFGEEGYLDADGFLYLTGRAQDMIVSGGVNVYPAEVEAVLLAHSAVLDAAVLGLPDEEFGQRVVAVVELAGSVASGELDRHCRESLAGFKVPRSYRTLSVLPREASGKLRRRTLGALFGEAGGTS